MKYAIMTLFLFLAATVHAGKIKCFRFDKDAIRVSIDKSHRVGRLMTEGKTVKLICQGELASSITCEGLRSTSSYKVFLSKSGQKLSANHFSAQVERNTRLLENSKIDLGTVSCFELN